MAASQIWTGAHANDRNALLEHEWCRNKNPSPANPMLQSKATFRLAIPCRNVLVIVEISRASEWTGGPDFGTAAWKGGY